MALIKLGASTITSLTDGTDTANKCNTLFDDVSDYVMADGAWTACTTRAALAQLTSTPAFEYSYEYNLPTNPYCLKVLAVNDIVTGDIGYNIEGRKLLSDSTGVKIKYLARIKDTESWGPHLTNAIVHRLAAELAYPLTGSLQTAEAMFGLYQQALNEGLAADGQQGSNEYTVSDDLDKVR